MGLHREVSNCLEQIIEDNKKDSVTQRLFTLLTDTEVMILEPSPLFGSKIQSVV